MNVDDIYKTVDKGIDYLNKTIPRWYEKINLDIFDINHWQKCPLGQIYGDYAIGWKKLGLSQGDCLNYGLAANYDDSKYFDEVWKEKIKNLQNPKTSKSLEDRPANIVIQNLNVTVNIDGRLSNEELQKQVKLAVREALNKMLKE
jgi:hypothetical protein